MKHYLAILCLALMATACVNDDTDFSDLIKGGDNPPEKPILPIEINLDFSELAEAGEVIPTDETDPTYNDYEENTNWSYTVNIDYSGETATLSGNTSRVRITQEGAHVVIQSTSNRVHYVLSGSSNNGSFKIYSENKFKLTLNGVTLTNPNGAAINNQGGKSLYLVLADGTNNTLTDGTTYTDVEGEQMKGAFFSEGQVLVSGKGSLEVNARGRNGIVSDDYFRFRPGCKIHVKASGGHGIKANDGIYVDGGVLNIELSADGAKGIRCDSLMNMTGGRVTIITTGGATIDKSVTPADTSSCAGIKCDRALNISGGALMLKSTGDGGKGINNTEDINITGGTIKVVATGIKDLASPKGIKGDAKINISGGYVYSYSANGSPIDADGGLSVKLGYVTWENLPQRVIISYVAE